ncbi:OmpA family protein [Saprospira grandis]|uniref:OmpA/MotB domain protein n=1 Tax=Saprospira grandis (strain Lewin) TaxID=984262 RepID=H6L607_SAPGL|nr:OmpA family protein [Saprospira grandis]AFC26567.1 OmpA/MotB domain protein [Saprospira grandis str. Lewin]
MKKFIPLLYLIPCFLQAQGLELIPNPSFENYRQAEPLGYGGPQNFRTDLAAWQSPNLASPDLWLRSKKKLKKLKFALSELSYIDLPQSGNNMLGLKIYDENSEEREYVQIQLQQALKKGERYRFSFWVCKKKSAAYYSHGLGLAFSDSLFVQQQHGKLEGISPQFVFEEVMQAENWQLYSQEFIADHSAQTLIIGYFASQNKLERLPPFPGEKAMAYYLIDDVSLRSLSDSSRPEIILSPIAFDYKKASLRPHSKKELQKLILLLQKWPELKLNIAGHTDTEGSEASNLRLSQERAKAVYDYLIQEGITKDRLSYKGFGESQAVKGKSAQENRRVVFSWVN